MATVKEQLQKIIADGDDRVKSLDEIIVRKEDAQQDATFERGMATGILRIVRQVEAVLRTEEFARLLQADENGAYYSQRVQ